MSEIGSGGYHWQDRCHVSRWDEVRETLDPIRAEAFSELVKCLPPEKRKPLQILDLGAGDGKVASVVLDEYPNAHAALVDFSEPMIDKGVAQLTRFANRYSYYRWNMNEGDWPSELKGPFDAIVSSAAIHHLVDDRKAWLAERIFERLVSSGVFANYDLFRDPTAVFAPEEVHDRTCATLEDAEGFLADAGFTQITATARSPRPKRNGELVLLTGRKPAFP